MLLTYQWNFTPSQGQRKTEKQKTEKRKWKNWKQTHSTFQSRSPDIKA